MCYQCCFCWLWSLLPSLTSSSHVGWDWSTTTLMILTSWGKIFHGAPDRGWLMVFLFLFWTIAPAVATSFHQASCWWSYSSFQPYASWQSCPWHPLTAFLCLAHCDGNPFGWHLCFIYISWDQKSRQLILICVPQEQAANLWEAKFCLGCRDQILSPLNDMQISS